MASTGSGEFAEATRRFPGVSMPACGTAVFPGTGHQRVWWRPAGRVL